MVRGKTIYHSLTSTRPSSLFTFIFSSALTTKSKTSMSHCKSLITPQLTILLRALRLCWLVWMTFKSHFCCRRLSHRPVYRYRFMIKLIPCYNASLDPIRCVWCFSLNLLRWFAFHSHEMYFKLPVFFFSYYFNENQAIFIEIHNFFCCAVLCIY